MGWVHYYARNYDKAIAKLEEVLELEPNFIPAHLWLGLAQQQIGRVDEVVERLQKAIDLSEGSPLMWSVRVLFLACAG